MSKEKRNTLEAMAYRHASSYFSERPFTPDEQERPKPPMFFELTESFRAGYQQAIDEVAAIYDRKSDEAMKWALEEKTGTGASMHIATAGHFSQQAKTIRRLKE